MSERLPARLEATALIRRVEATAGFATIIKRGDADRGALILVVAERGVPKALLERRMGGDYRYIWTVVAEVDNGNSEKFRESTDKRVGFDPDCWLIELDVADAERFIAETIASP